VQRLLFLSDAFQERNVFFFSLLLFFVLQNVKYFYGFLLSEAFKLFGFDRL
jgi:hypothetical protein